MIFWKGTIGVSKRYSIMCMRYCARYGSGVRRTQVIQVSYSPTHMGTRTFRQRTDNETHNARLAHRPHNSSSIESAAHTLSNSSTASPFATSPSFRSSPVSPVRDSIRSRKGSRPTSLASCGFAGFQNHFLLSSKKNHPPIALRIWSELR